MMTNTTYQKSGRSGFTLLEILVVMIIIGILTTIGIRGFVQSQIKTRDAQRKHDLEQVKRALELYYNDYDQYPADSGDGLIKLADGTELDWGSEFTDSNGTVYMIKLPRDPRGYSYYYETLNDNKSYYLYAYLENDQDRHLTAEEGHASTDCNLSGSDLDCNYAVSSVDLPLPTAEPTPEHEPGDECWGCDTSGVNCFEGSPTCEYNEGLECEAVCSGGGDES